MPVIMVTEETTANFHSYVQLTIVVTTQRAARWSRINQSASARRVWTINMFGTK